MTAGRFSLNNVTMRSAAKPDRIVLYADAGWGKTTFVTRMPKPICLMTVGEDRLLKLIEEGLCPPTAHFPELCRNWDDLEEAVRTLTTQEHDYRTLVMDTGNGLERLGQEKVCAEDYDGNWGGRGFASFGEGEKVTADRLWLPFLHTLDRLRIKRRMRIVLICHKGIVTVRNPEGADYDKIGPALSKRAWGYTAKWADMVLYGALEMQVAKDDPKSKVARHKAKGGRVRLLHTQPTPAFEAKNVHRLPPTIRLGDDPDSAYEAFRKAFPAKPEAAPPATPAAETSARVRAETLAKWQETMTALRWTDADREEVLAELKLKSFADASDDQIHRLISDALAAGGSHKNDGTGPEREPGDDGAETDGL